MFAVLQGRLMQLATNTEYAQAQLNKSEYVLSLNNARGNIYDSNFVQLTGTQQIPYALISPGEKNYKLLFDSVADGSKNGFYTNTGKLMPFLIEIKKSSASNQSNVFYSTKRYLQLPIAPQLIGYLDNEGNGVSGIEYAFDHILQNADDAYSVKAITNANGQLISNKPPQTLIDKGSGNGIMLCIDSRIQRLCEAAAIDKIDKGAIVVMETKTGRIRASVSMPVFDPSNTAQSLNSEDAPFINRVTSQFSAGSVFKPLLVAAALENGYLKSLSYDCKGYIDVDGQIYRCAYGKGHGEIDMEQALCESCNCYFVNLGMLLGAQNIYDYAFNAGFGESTVFAGNVLTTKGNLPSVDILINTGELANISFGQGKLTVSPLQITAFMNIFANDGIYISPSFVEGIVNKRMVQITQSLYAPMQRRALEQPVARLTSKMLASVVDNGLAAKAKPYDSTAAGKTGTAQTGRFNENGDELMDAWFTGYFPAENPKYTITVLLDSGLHNSDNACEVFANIVNALNLLGE